MFPLLPPPRRRLREGGRRGNGARTAHGHLIFMKNLPGSALIVTLIVTHCNSPTRERPQPHGRDRRTAPALLQSPPVWALPAGDSHIHWGLIRPYDAQTEFGEHVSRPRGQASCHNSVANLVWQRAEACNRSRAREPDAPSISYPRPHHHIDTSDRPRSWAPQPRASTMQPSLSDPYHRAPQPPRHTEPRDHRASRYDLDHPARNRLYEAQRQQAPGSAVPPVLTSQTVIIGSDLLRRPREAETHQCILSRTPTRQTLRPALIGLTHRHARLPAERKILSRVTVSAAPPDSRSLHTAVTS